MKPLSIFPPVSFPVSSSTPMLNSLIRWDHAAEWPVVGPQQYVPAGLTGSGQAASFDIDISSAESEDAYMSGHVVDGRVLLPATGYLMLAWKHLARMSGQAVGESPVIFEDVGLHRATLLPTTGE